MKGLSGRGSTRLWRRTRALVLDRDGHRCQLPTASGPLCGAHASHVDHILPRKLGGSDRLSNLRAACSSCNLRRGARSTSPDDAPTYAAAPTVGAVHRSGFRW